MWKFLTIIIMLILILIMGCNNIEDINKINSAPQKFLNKEIAIKGYITTVIDIPFSQQDFFKINDGTGEIWILSQKGAPPSDIKATVKGTLQKNLNLSFLNLNIPNYYLELNEIEF